MEKQYEEFLKSYPTYRCVSDNPEMKYIFEEILSRDENVIKMYNAVQGDKPALAAVVDEIERYYDQLKTPHITLANSERGILTKRAIGSMVAMIMRDLGYTSNGQRYLPYTCSRKYYVCGSVYKKTLPARLRVVVSLEVVDCKMSV